MRVALLCGDCPPGACGVGDYTRCLARALTSMAIEVHVLDYGKGKAQDSIVLHRTLRQLGPDVVHIQYPTIGFGSNFGPQVIALLRSCVVTLHESRRSHILRKLAELPFSVRSKRIVFPSQLERSFATRCVPWIAQRSSVISIPSNIGAGVSRSMRNLSEIVHFGLIMPNKGLESVLQLGHLIQALKLPLRLRIIGTVAPKYADYFQGLQGKSSHLPIIWENGLDKTQVEDLLATSAVAYLPYPDGASERRASLKAALINGVAVLTTLGPDTPPDLHGAVEFVRNPEQALGAALNLLANAEERSKLAVRGVRYARPYTWEEVAAQHSAIYAQVLREGDEALLLKNNEQPRASS